MLGEAPEAVPPKVGWSVVNARFITICYHPTRIIMDDMWINSIWESPFELK